MARAQIRCVLSVPVVALLGALEFLGCGYSMGYQETPGVSTIAVPIFDNRTFRLRRELEYDLTDAVRKEVQTRTPLVLVDSKQADLILFGAITRFDERVVGESPVDEKTESRLYMTVELVIEDYVNSQRRSERVVVNEPVSIEIGETLRTARERAIGNLAEKIVNTMESW